MNARTTSALILSAVKACQEAGLTVGAVEVMQGGVVRVLAPEAINSLPSKEGDNTCDNLFGAGSD